MPSLQNESLMQPRGPLYQRRYVNNVWPRSLDPFYIEWAKTSRTNNLKFIIIVSPVLRYVYTQSVYNFCNILLFFLICNDAQPKAVLRIRMDISRSRIRERSGSNPREKLDPDPSIRSRIRVYEIKAFTFHFFLSILKGQNR